MDTRFTSLNFTPFGVALESAKIVILPVPYDLGLSWMPGARLGPRSILEASQEVERYNFETECIPAEAGIYTAPAFGGRGDEISGYENRIQIAAEQYIEQGKFLLSLGGDHSITFPLVEAQLAFDEDIGLIHFDAHTDLWQSYQGSISSHATPMYRLAKDKVKILSVGIRLFTPEQRDIAHKLGVEIITNKRWWKEGLGGLEKALQRLPKRVYLSLDLDSIDPAEMPAVGTPLPGGFTYEELLEALQLVFNQKEVAGMDLVEFSPVPGLHFPQMTAAQLAYSILGMKALQAGWVQSEPIEVRETLSR